MQRFALFIAVLVLLAFTASRVNQTLSSCRTEMAELKFPKFRSNNKQLLLPTNVSILFIFKVIPLKLFYYQNFLETWRN